MGCCCLHSLCYSKNQRHLIHCRSFASRWTDRSCSLAIPHHTSCRRQYLHVTSSRDYWPYHSARTCPPSGLSVPATSGCGALLAQLWVSPSPPPHSTVLTVTQRTYLRSLYAAIAWLAFLRGKGYSGYWFFHYLVLIRSDLPFQTLWCLAWLFVGLWPSLATGKPCPRWRLKTGSFLGQHGAEDASQPSSWWARSHFDFRLLKSAPRAPLQLRKMHYSFSFCYYNRKQLTNYILR